MSFRRRTTPTSPQTCPGIRDLIRPTMTYVKCRVCGGDVEIWSDEDVSVCLECGAEWRRPDEDAACLKYCEHAEICRGIIRARAGREV